MGVLLLYMYEYKLTNENEQRVTFELNYSYLIMQIYYISRVFRSMLVYLFP